MSPVPNLSNSPALFATFVGAPAVLAAATALAFTSPLGVVSIGGSLGLYAAGTGVMLSHFHANHPHARFGAANAVTLVRFGLACLFGGLVLDIALTDLIMPPAMAWLFFALAWIGMLLDGVDGLLARRQSIATPFGARFDMEVDALQILLLAALAYALGKCGAWILAGGALRYVFWVSGMIWPALSQPLEPSLRRKVAAVVQGGTMATLLAPVVTPPLSSLAAAAALTLLIYSFATDVLWLLRSQRPAYSRGP